MSTFGLIAFSAMAMLLMVVPSPLCRFAASFSQQRGRRAALVTIPGLVIGFCLATALAAVPLFVITSDWPQVTDQIAVAGTWIFGIYVVYACLQPGRRQPMADNDNLPERRNVRIVGLLVRHAVLSPRYAVALFAIMLQVWNSALPFLPQLAAIELACAAVAALAAVVHVLLPRRFMDRTRRARRAKPALRKPQTVFIARRAVTAGYRRIAA